MKKPQEAGVVEFKSRVDRIADFLKSQGYDVQHMHLMEGIARYEGVRDWRTYRALLSNPPVQPPALVPNQGVEVATDDRCLIEPGDASDAQSAAMSEMLYEWADELSFTDILAILRGTKMGGNVSASTGYTHLSRSDLANELESRARCLQEESQLEPAAKCTTAVEDHALSCLEYWGSLTFVEILEILDSEDPERRKEIDVHPSLIDFSNRELAEIIRREHRWAVSQAADRT